MNELCEHELDAMSRCWKCDLKEATEFLADMTFVRADNRPPLDVMPLHDAGLNYHRGIAAITEKRDSVLRGFESAYDLAQRRSDLRADLEFTMQLNSCAVEAFDDALRALGGDVPERVWPLPLPAEPAQLSIDEAVRPPPGRTTTRIVTLPYDPNAPAPDVFELMQQANRKLAQACAIPAEMLSAGPRLGTAAYDAMLGRVRDEVVGLVPMKPSKPAPKEDAPFVPRKFGEHG